MTVYYADPQDIRNVTSWIGDGLTEKDAHRLLFPEDKATLETMELNDMYEMGRKQALERLKP